MRYTVKITETLVKSVSVEADSIEEAEDIVSEGWHRSEYILDAEDFVEVNFTAESEDGFDAVFDAGTGERTI